MLPSPRTIKRLGYFNSIYHFPDLYAIVMMYFNSIYFKSIKTLQLLSYTASVSLALYTYYFLSFLQFRPFICDHSPTVQSIFFRISFYISVLVVPSLGFCQPRMSLFHLPSCNIYLLGIKFKWQSSFNTLGMHSSVFWFPLLLLRNYLPV